MSEARKELFIGNIKAPYDKTSGTINVEKAKLEFPDHEYIGTGSNVYINGIYTELEQPFHFFKLKTK